MLNDGERIKTEFVVGAEPDPDYEDNFRTDE